MDARVNFLQEEWVTKRLHGKAKWRSIRLPAVICLIMKAECYVDGCKSKLPSRRMGHKETSRQG